MGRKGREGGCRGEGKERCGGRRRKSGKKGGPWATVSGLSKGIMKGRRGEGDEKESEGWIRELEEVSGDGDEGAGEEKQ